MAPLGVLLLLPALSGDPASAVHAPGQDACAVCHGTEGQALKRGVHARAGVTCADCHGGGDGGGGGAVDPQDPHDADMRPLTDPREAVAACGGCHSDLERMQPYGLRTDQLATYWTSQHGRRLAEDGDAEVATCVSCHGAHAVRAPADPRSPVHDDNQLETCGGCHGDADLMDRYGLTAEPPEAYRRSVHGRALLELGRPSSPSCTDCHGSHGALPPRVETVGQVCGDCHGEVREHFEAGAHMPAVEAGALTECISCHGHHDVSPASPELLSGGGRGHCAECHDDPADPALEVAHRLREGLADLNTMIAETEDELERAALRGLFLGREEDYLEEARGLRTRAAAVVHALSPEKLAGLRDRSRGMIDQTLQGLEKQERSLRDRRIFAIVFLFVVLLLVGVLLVFRREISTGWETSLRTAGRRAERGPEAGGDA